VEFCEEMLSSSLTVSVLNPSLRVLSISSAAVGVGVEKLEEMILDLSWTDGSVELSELVSSSDSSWYIGTLAFTLVKKGHLLSETLHI